MKPGVQDLEIYQGDSFVFTFRVRPAPINDLPQTPYDITGWTAKSQIRSTETSGTVIAEFNCAVTDQTISSNLGIVVITLDPTTTAALAPTANVKLVWDVQLTTAAGFQRTYLKGQVTINPEVTRP